MVRFANDCLMRMKEVVQRLEVSLGPDTADLGMRFGVSSGTSFGSLCYATFQLTFTLALV